LLTSHPAPARDGADRWTCGGWTASRSLDGGLLLTGVGADDLDAVRALCAAAWSGDPVGARRPVGGDGPAAGVLARLGLDGARRVAGRRD
jgi:hypothetical protein